MVPQVGDFVAAGDHLFRVFRPRGSSTGGLIPSLAIGQERTLEQDPTFAFRILVDIASKGLSPAINDPTTAVLAIDQIHHLLRNVGGRLLSDGHVRDAAGRLRLLYRTPNWDDFVCLAVTEIRQFGSESIQVACRLRAMLEDLLWTLPAEHHHLLRRSWNYCIDPPRDSSRNPTTVRLAAVGDLQGVGGNADATRLRGKPGDQRASLKVTTE